MRAKRTTALTKLKEQVGIYNRWENHRCASAEALGQPHPPAALHDVDKLLDPSAKFPWERMDAAASVDMQAQDCECVPVSR